MRAGRVFRHLLVSLHTRKVLTPPAESPATEVLPLTSTSTERTWPSRTQWQRCPVSSPGLAGYLRNLGVRSHTPFYSHTPCHSCPPCHSHTPLHQTHTHGHLHRVFWQPYAPRRPRRRRAAVQLHDALAASPQLVRPLCPPRERAKGGGIDPLLAKPRRARQLSSSSSSSTGGDAGTRSLLLPLGAPPGAASTQLLPLFKPSDDPPPSPLTSPLP